MGSERPTFGRGGATGAPRAKLVLVSRDDPRDKSRRDETPEREDVVLVGNRVEGGDGYHVLRKRDERVELGELRAAKSGRPVHGELVRLRARENAERLFDVEVLAKAPKPERDRADDGQAALERSGPAQVATDAYRKNWDTIFGARRSKRAERPN